MSSNTPTQKFEQSVQAGLQENELTPEDFDREEAERRKAMARAFALRETPGRRDRALSRTPRILATRTQTTRTNTARTQKTGTREADNSGRQAS